MATKGYEVLVPELSVLETVGTLRDSGGNEIGVQNGPGKVYFKGQIVPAEKVSKDIIDALEDEDHPSHEAVSERLKPSSSASESALAEPFPGYDDMDEDAVLAALPNLPSASVALVKEYEAENEGRDSIVDFNVGFGESPSQRQQGKIGSELSDEPDESKAVRRLQTRSVPDEGEVVAGEGITGTGDPQRPYGEGAGDTDKTTARSGRRSRAKSKTQKGGTSSDEGTPSKD